jgi:phosphoglycolate phosphatase
MGEFEKQEGARQSVDKYLENNFLEDYAGVGSQGLTPSPIVAESAANLQIFNPQISHRGGYVKPGKKIVLLDLDGTIGDTSSGIVASVKYALRETGVVPGLRKELTAEELNEFIGPPIFDAMRDAGVPLDRIDDAINKYRYAYSQPVFPVPMFDFNTGDLTTTNVPGMFLSSAFDGVPEMMRELAEHEDWIIITGTSKPELWARAVIQKFELDQFLTPVPHVNQLQSGLAEDSASSNASLYLDYEGADQQIPVSRSETDGIFGASMDKSRAAKSQVLRYALDAVGFDKIHDRAILVGDRRHDINGAKEIGIDVVGCHWGYAQPTELDSATFIITKPNELNTLLSKYFG